MNDKRSSPAPLNATLEAAIELARKGELAKAEELLGSVLERDPGAARAHNALGIIQFQQCRLEAAEASYLRALQLTPEDPKIHLNLGNLFSAQGRAADAEAQYRRSIQLEPANAAAHFNFAVLLQAEGRLEEAETELRHALELEPGDAEAIYRLAGLLLRRYQFAEAEALYRAAIRLRPEFAAAFNDLAMVLLETGRLLEARQSCRQAVRLNPGYLQGWSNYVMCGEYDPGATAAERLDWARQAGRAAAAASARFAKLPLPAGNPATRLKVGFVSGDLHHHPVGFFLLPLLRNLDREQIQVTLYSNGAVSDAVSEQLRSHASWNDIGGIPDGEVWSRIRADQLDALIDLSGHTGGNRLAVFAGRAAPLQLSWLGYFATTGTPNMDFVLMDPWHAPAGTEVQFSEKILRLPHARFCYQPLEAAPPVRPRSPASSRGQVAFGSFNNIAKINDRVIAAWSRILQGVAGSRLVLKWRTLADARFRRDLAARFETAGVNPDRLELRPASDHVAMLGEYADIDIALDTFPFTGGQTSCESLWMGVPVITLPGPRPVSRQTLCILGNAGLEEFAARDEDGYVHSAIALAQDRPRLSELRSSMRDRMSKSPLMQAPEFARAFAAALHDALGA